MLNGFATFPLSAKSIHPGELTKKNFSVEKNSLLVTLSYHHLLESSIMLRIQTAIAAVALSFAVAGETSAHEAEADEGRLCNPVHDKTDAALMTKNGRFVIHGGTEECPVPEPVVQAKAPTPEPEPAPEPVVIASISGDVAFDLNKSTLKPEFYPELNSIIATLNESPETKFEIVGHADSTGEADYNQGLSERRALAVADYFKKNGVSENRFTTSGRGEMDPVASNETKEGRAKNRRVDIQS
jgi:outer membrane protein OmpA-like peptidoglycan-associated protein